MGRPPLKPSEQPIIVQTKLRLYPGADDDLIEFFQDIPSGYRADAVKAALRSGNIGAVEIEDLPADDVLAGALEELLL
jgi:hypothetical protein